MWPSRNLGRAKVGIWPRSGRDDFQASRAEIQQLEGRAGRARFCPISHFCTAETLMRSRANTAWLTCGSLFIKPPPALRPSGNGRHAELVELAQRHLPSRHGLGAPGRVVHGFQDGGLGLTHRNSPRSVRSPAPGPSPVPAGQQVRRELASSGRRCCRAGSWRSRIRTPTALFVPATTNTLPCPGARAQTARSDGRPRHRARQRTKARTPALPGAPSVKPPRRQPVPPDRPFIAPVLHTNWRSSTGGCSERQRAAPAPASRPRTSRPMPARSRQA